VASVEIITVERPRQMRAFIDLPWKIYAGYANWVPPMKSEVRRLLDPKRHPFWRFSQRVLFLARRGSEPLGRISGIVDGNYNRLHNERMGIWGFFECADDLQIASALFSSVEAWARSKGMTFLRGPLNPSTNYEVGMLVEGFEHPPALMMSYNPPYYIGLVESCGFVKEKDLVAYMVDRDYQPPDWFERLAERLTRKGDVRIRPIDLKNLDRELPRVRETYNASWFDNWGFVPLTQDEMREIGKRLRRIADPELSFFVYYKDEPVGVCVILPDINRLLKRLDGKIGVLGPLKILLHRGEITGLRGLIFGVKERYRQLGLPLVAFDYVYRVLREKKRYEYLEMGWTLEDNQSINLLEEEAGAALCKRYRIFRKSL
jgi:hypothetical protein